MGKAMLPALRYWHSLIPNCEHGVMPRCQILDVKKPRLRWELQPLYLWCD